MGVIGTILYFVGIIGQLICLVMVLIKMFPAEGTLKGILGLICGLYSFIWGWINAARFNLRNVMLAWTACIVLTVIGGIMGGASFGASVPQGFISDYLTPFVSVVAALIGF